MLQQAMVVRENVMQDVLSLFGCLTPTEKALFLHETRKSSCELLPISIFHTNLSTLQAVVYYLKHHMHLRTSNIASLLHRDPATISMTFAAATKKLKGKMVVDDDCIHVPITIFQQRHKSVLGSLIRYLKEQERLKLVDIADLLHKNRNTIKSTHGRYNNG
jgi:hypothetical protein